jgi:CheY-like chemotaxis protein
MTTLGERAETRSDSGTLKLLTERLSGKRSALIGFKDAVAEQISEMLAEAQAFTRNFTIDTQPSAEVLKPFELLLIDVDGANGSHWLTPENLNGVTDRSLAVGSRSVLLDLVTDVHFPHREFCVWPASRDELLFRCVLVLRSSSRAASRLAAQNSIVVLADDDPSITALVRLTLQRSGMQCEVASNGTEALELINKWKPSAAILDIGMPNINGFEVLSRIRSDAAVAPTKVLLLTGSEQEADVLRGFSLGADDYVTKPFNPMEVLMRLKRAIGRI